ncbi:unnamed protein product [Adineta steineri]|uniref:Uncharacterized protein n=1 Tax=Adineta steineri TaxID=433720 RepID=A0A819PIP5_9BILA|nr:unnamed protein product [Adineta steineri]CAF4015026.1 unnamed protein product [Adineta steineri]
MGFYIKDLHQDIKRMYSARNNNKKMITYRGDVMPNADFEKLKNNVGRLISFNGFLSTTTNSIEAVWYTEYAEVDPQVTGIIFQMEVEPSSSTVSFVSLSDVNDTPFCENEILFSMHTVFRVDEVEQLAHNQWSVNLTMTGVTDDQLQRLAEHLRKEIQGSNPLDRLGKLLIKMGEFDKAEEIVKTLLKTISNVDRKQIVSLYNQFGYICKEKANFSEALIYHGKALELQQQIPLQNDSILANIYNNIGEVHRLIGDYSTALSYYEKALQIYQDSLSSDHPELLVIHNNITQVYNSLGDYSAALSNLQKTLEIQENSLPPNHPDLAATYENIGRMHYAMGEYSTALSHHQKVLEIQQKSLPSDHPLLAVTNNNIGQVYQKMGEHSTALSYHQRALEIQQKSLPSNHPDLATTHSNIGQAYDSIKNYSTALSHLETTLTIQKESLPENHPDFATTFENIGRVHYAMERYSDALSYHQRALEIRQKSLPSNHPSLAVVNNNIGQAHQAMKEYPTAQSYYQKALEIQHQSLPPSHPDLAVTYNNMGELCVAMNDYKNAISYYKKMLRIQQVALSSDHPSLAVTYNKIGRVYELREHYTDARSSFEKALKIQQKILPPDHSDLATIYHSIAEMYQLTGDYSSALSHHNKTLETRTKFLPPNHALLAQSHHHIAMILEGLHRYEEAVKHVLCAINIAQHNSESDQSLVQKYQQYLDEILRKPECGDLAKTKNNSEWIYPCLLVLQAAHQSRLHSILYDLTDGHLIPPCLPHEWLTMIEANEEVKSIVFEISTNSVDERDRLLKDFSSIDQVESIYVLGEQSETREERYKFLSSFCKVAIFCKDEEELAVRWALDTANQFRRLGGQYADAGKTDLARQYFQRGKDLYKGLAKIIDQTKSMIS